MDFIQVLWDVAVYFSMAGLVFLVITFLIGLRVIKPKPKLHLHKKLSICAFVLIAIHATIMLYFYFFT
jgi:DMSO/TMAO reductase YedYZ heme-binding membrane subunit